MNTPDYLFDKWFNELEGFSFVGERFFSDLDSFGIAYKNKDFNREQYYSSQIMMRKWLEAAFEEGKKCR